MSSQYMMLGTGMLVKTEVGAGPLLPTSHKMDNTVGGHSTADHHQNAVALSNQSMGNGTGGSQGGSSSGRSSPADPSPNKLFVGGLSWQTTSDRLREYFGAYGTVKDVLIMKDPITQRSRGFGFITFGDPSSVEKVIAVPNHVLDGKKIDPKHATPKNRGRNNKTKKIFVGGVSQETTNDEVRQYFSQFGKVEEAVMLMDNQTKRHRGFGFVTFECEDVVERVCEIHFHTIKNKKVECKKAQPKEAVQAATMLTKRLMMPPTGIPMPGMTPYTVAQQQAAAFASAQAALSTYGKLVGGTYPPLSAYRYTPYPLPPTAAATHQNTAAVSQLSQQSSHHAAAAAAAAAAAHGHHQQALTAPPPPQSTQQAYATNGHHALSAANAAAAAGGHSMVASGVPHSQAPVFTSPTTLAPHNFTAAAAAAAAAHHGAATLTPSYPGYTLGNVDMSSFQGVDWSAMYNVGMYT